MTVSDCAWFFNCSFEGSITRLREEFFTVLRSFSSNGSGRWSACTGDGEFGVREFKGFVRRCLKIPCRSGLVRIRSSEHFSGATRRP